MQCPYCGSTVTQVKTGNTQTQEMCVVEGEETFDVDISMYQCDTDKQHLFYADDEAGNSIAGLPRFKVLNKKKSGI